MSDRPYSERVLVGGYKGIRRFLTLFPPRLVVNWLALLARWYAVLRPKEREISIAQLRFAARSVSEPSFSAAIKDPAKRERIVRRCFGHIGESLAELLLIDRLGYRLQDNPSVVDVRPLFSELHLQELVDRVKRGESCLALCGHIGNFELLAAAYRALGAPLSVLGRLPNYPSLAALLDFIRHDYGVEVIWRNDAGSAKKLLRAVKAGHIIGALLDQDTNLTNGFADFFGLDAASPIEIVQLAVRMKLPVYSTFIVREGRLRHRAVANEIAYDPNAANASEEILKIYNQRLEQFIIAYPDQWPWWHRRWRRRPGEDYEKHPERLMDTQAYLQWLAAQSPQSASEFPTRATA